MRVLTGKKIRRTASEKDLLMRENEAMRGCDENPLKGDYNLIYPNSNFDRQKKYDIFIEAAK